MGYIKEIDYTELWIADKQSILTTMHKNLTADLEAGYNYFGKSIQSQLAEISRYTADYEMQLNALREISLHTLMSVQGKMAHWK